MKPALDADEFLFREYLTRLNADPAGFMHDEDTVAGLAEVIHAAHQVVVSLRQDDGAERRPAYPLIALAMYRRFDAESGVDEYVALRRGHQVGVGRAFRHPDDVVHARGRVLVCQVDVDGARP